MQSLSICYHLLLEVLIVSSSVLVVEYTSNDYHINGFLDAILGSVLQIN